MTEESKKCRACDNEMPIDEFKNARGTVFTNCRLCRAKWKSSKVGKYIKKANRKPKVKPLKPLVEYTNILFILALPGAGWITIDMIDALFDRQTALEDMLTPEELDKAEPRRYSGGLKEFIDRVLAYSL
jgi:hypothetical protein